MEKELIKKMGKFSAYIEADQDAMSPQELGDDNLFLVGFHRQFFVDHKGLDQERVSAILRNDQDEEWKDTVNEWRKDYHVFGLEAYIHSGVSLALATEGKFPDRQWDVSYVGAVFVAKEEFKDKDEARKRAKGLIEEWNTYLSGDVWIVFIEDENEEPVDSVCGIYGRKYAEEEVLRMLKSVYEHEKKNPKPIDYSTFTLGALMSHEDETIKRNAMSILKRLPKLKAEQDQAKKFMRAQKKLPFPKK